MGEEAGMKEDLVEPAFDSSFPHFGGTHDEARGAARSVVDGVSQLALGAWSRLGLPRGEYYVRFVR
jgi:hypothetical protein